MIVRSLLILMCCLNIGLSLAGGGKTAKLHAMYPNVEDKASLQRGARLYMNYCAGCHSLKYMRYNRMAKDMGIVDDQGKVDVQLVKDNLIFTDDKIFNTIETAMPMQQAAAWFGVAPPDLSLVSRVRGVDWLYTYLLQFYRDPNKAWGTNNLLFADVAMPNVLLPLQGEQQAVYRDKTLMVEGKEKTLPVIDHLMLAKLGKIGSTEFDQSIYDLVNFLAYVGEPAQLARHRLGPWVLGFVAFFTLLAFWLKKEYWKDIH